MLYTFRKYKDVYTVFNTGLVVLTYKLERIECDSTKVVAEGTIAVGQTITLPINFVDGVYRLTLNDGIVDEVLPNILHYNNLLLSFIESAEEVLCGCKKCNECEDCNTCETYLNTINKALGYLYVNAPKYNEYLNEINEQLKCLYTEKVLCILTNKMISGDEDTKNLFLQIIGSHYLAFYLVDLVQAFDAEEAEYIKCKYISSKVLKCLRKHGIDIDESTELISNDMVVHYWQINDLFDDITDIVAVFNNLYLNDKPSVPFEEFEAGKTVTYTSIGRIAFAVKETEVVNFIIYDLLGNDVTDEFDTHYFNTEKTALFVSKIPYSHSSMFFKFKKVTF